MAEGDKGLNAKKTGTPGRIDKMAKHPKAARVIEAGWATADKLLSYFFSFMYTYLSKPRNLHS